MPGCLCPVTSTRSYMKISSCWDNIIYFKTSKTNLTSYNFNKDIINNIVLRNLYNFSTLPVKVFKSLLNLLNLVKNCYNTSQTGSDNKTFEFLFYYHYVPIYKPCEEKKDKKSSFFKI